MKKKKSIHVLSKLALRFPFNINISGRCNIVMLAGKITDMKSYGIWSHNLHLQVNWLILAFSSKDYVKKMHLEIWPSANGIQKPQFFHPRYFNPSATVY